VLFRCALALQGDEKLWNGPVLFGEAAQCSGGVWLRLVVHWYSADLKRKSPVEYCLVMAMYR